MRRLYLALCFLAASVSASFAQSCQTLPDPVDFVNKAAVAVPEAGGVSLLGSKAAAFGKELGVQADVIAAFVVPDGEDLVLVLVYGDTACIGLANDRARGIIKRHFGVPA